MAVWKPIVIVPLEGFKGARVSDHYRRFRSVASICNPQMGKIGLGNPCYVVGGGATSRSLLSADVFYEKASARVGLVTLPQKEGDPVPWLVFSATWVSPDTHDTLYRDTGEEGCETPIHWLCDTSVLAKKGTISWYLKKDSFSAIQRSLNAHPLVDDTGVFRLLLPPRRLPCWFYVYPSLTSCQLLLQL